MKLLQIGLASLAIAFGACSALPPIPPKPPAPCGTACAHLRELGCPSGSPTPAGATCEEVCKSTEAAEIAEIRWPAACVIAAESCDVAEQCH